MSHPLSGEADQERRQRLRELANRYQTADQRRDELYIDFVAEVNAAYDAGWGGSEIAECVGLTESGVRMIRERSRKRRTSGS